MPGEVLVISGFWPTRCNPISGIFVVQQIAAFCRAGHAVSVLLGRTVGKQRSLYLSPSELGLPEDRVKLLEMPFLRVPERLSANGPAFSFNVRSIGRAVSRGVASVVRSGRGPYEGCIVHGLRYFGLTVPYWSEQITGRKVVFVHGFDPFLAKPGGADLFRPHLSRAQDCTDRTILVGSPLRNYAVGLGLGLDPAKTVVIPNGTEIPALPEQVATEGGTDALKIVSVSNLIAWKGIDDNIRALSILDTRFGIGNWRYSVVGDGPERQRLEALAASFGLADRIRFLGRLPYAETMLEIEKADLFSLPSWAEAFGIVYLEAMARRVPTIGCLQNGAADIITDGQDGLLVPPKAPEALAQAVKRLFDQPALRRALGQKGRQTAELYSWDVNARRVLDLLNS